MYIVYTGKYVYTVNESAVIIIHAETDRILYTLCGILYTSEKTDSPLPADRTGENMQLTENSPAVH